MNAEQLRQLSEIFRDEIEGAEEGVSIAETLQRISDRIFAMACDGAEDEEEADATGYFRVGDAVRAAEDIFTMGDNARRVPKGTPGTITAAGGGDWVTVRFQGGARDWRCHVDEVDR